MQELVLDTDILSEILKGFNQNVAGHMNAYQSSFQQLTFTSISVMEILTGYRKRGAPAKKQRAMALFGMNLEIVPIAADYRLAADITGDLHRRGQFIGLLDPLIAACAISRGYGVASGNTRHFEFIQEAGYEFHLENWRDPGVP